MSKDILPQLPEEKIPALFEDIINEKTMNPAVCVRIANPLYEITNLLAKQYGFIKHDFLVEETGYVYYTLPTRIMKFCQNKNMWSFPLIG